MVRQPDSSRNFDQIINLLDSRVNYMFRKRYTKSNISLDDIFAKNQIDQGSMTNYIVARTFHRPREAILFLNQCIEKADGQARISITILRKAEASYSEARLKSIHDEWSTMFPGILPCVKFMRRREAQFTPKQIDVQECEDFAIEYLQNEPDIEDPVRKVLETCFLSEDTKCK